MYVVCLYQNLRVHQEGSKGTQYRDTNICIPDSHRQDYLDAHALKISVIQAVREPLLRDTRTNIRSYRNLDKSNEILIEKAETLRYISVKEGSCGKTYLLYRLPKYLRSK